MNTKQPSRSKLIESAGQLFIEKGYDATSVQDICEHAGVSKGAFYHHFESKQVVFMNLMEQWSGDVLESMLTNPIDPDKSTAEVLAEMPDQFASTFEAVPKGFPILVDFWRQSVGDPTMWKLAVEPYRYFIGFFTRIIEYGKADGSFRTDIDSEVLARLLVAVSMGYLLESAYDQENRDWQAITSEGFNLVIRGIGGKE